MTHKWMGLLIVVGMAIYSVLVLPALPAEIPIHWWAATPARPPAS